MRRIASLTATLGLMAWVAAPAVADTITLYVNNNYFSTDPVMPAPDPVIGVGDTVHWVWNSGTVPHSTQSVQGSIETWDSGIHQTGSPPFTFDHTFTNEGTFWYYCVVHGFDNLDGTAGGMAATIRVQAVPAPGALLTTLLGGVLPVAGLALRRLRRRG